MTNKEQHALNVGKLREIKVCIMIEKEALPIDWAKIDTLIREQVALETALISYITTNGPLS